MYAAFSCKHFSNLIASDKVSYNNLVVLRSPLLKLFELNYCRRQLIVSVAAKVENLQHRKSTNHQLTRRVEVVHCASLLRREYAKMSNCQREKYSSKD